MVLRQQQAGGVGRELAEGDASDVPALIELDNVFRSGIIEPELARTACASSVVSNTLRSDARLNSVSLVMRRSPD
jgi:hypothetical protein